MNGLAFCPVFPVAMSYQSLKRVLGETSLERKCRFLFGACLLVLISASFWMYGSQTERLVFEQNSKQAKLLVQQGLISLHAKKLGHQLTDAIEAALACPEFR